MTCRTQEVSNALGCKLFMDWCFQLCNDEYFYRAETVCFFHTECEPLPLYFIHQWYNVKNSISRQDIYWIITFEWQSVCKQSLPFTVNPRPTCLCCRRNGMYPGSPGTGHTLAHWPPCAAPGVTRDPGEIMITLINLSTKFLNLSFAKLVTLSGLVIIIWTAKTPNWHNQSSIDKTFMCLPLWTDKWKSPPKIQRMSIYRYDFFSSKFSSNL